MNPTILQKLYTTANRIEYRPRISVLSNEDWAKAYYTMCDRPIADAAKLILPCLTGGRNSH